jgi:hypothetical protein
MDASPLVFLPQLPILVETGLWETMIKTTRIAGSVLTIDRDTAWPDFTKVLACG